MIIILIGYMGSGKTAVGKQLAASLGVSFKDLDAEIEVNEQKTINELFLMKGEIYFRKKEREILNTILKQENNIVLTTGGGTLCYGDIMKLLLLDKNIKTIYLKASIDVLTNRLFKEKTQRPLISHIKTKKKLKDFISKHLFERSYFYNMASLKIDTNNLSISETVTLIKTSL